MALKEIFTKESILLDVKSTARDELFTEMVRALCSLYPELDVSRAICALNEREEKMSTGIMHSVGIPHAVVPSISKTIGCIAVSKKGIDYDSLDKAPVHLAFMLLTGEGREEEHVKILRELALVLTKNDFVNKALECKTSSEIYDLIVQYSK